MHGLYRKHDPLETVSSKREATPDVVEPAAASSSKKLAFGGKSKRCSAKEKGSANGSSKGKGGNGRRRLAFGSDNGVDTVVRGEPSGCTVPFRRDSDGENSGIFPMKEAADAKTGSSTATPIADEPEEGDDAGDAPRSADDNSSSDPEGEKAEKMAIDEVDDFDVTLSDCDSYQIPCEDEDWIGSGKVDDDDNNAGAEEKLDEIQAEDDFVGRGVVVVAELVVEARNRENDGGVIVDIPGSRRGQGVGQPEGKSEEKPIESDVSNIFATQTQDDDGGDGRLDDDR